MMAEAATPNGKHYNMDLKVLKQKIACTMCKKQYNHPKTLPCLHSFCLECLQTIVASNSSGTQIKCPQCLKEMQLCSNDLEYLPDAFLFGRQIDLYNFLLKVNGRVDVKCEKCSNRSVKANSFCRDCGKFVCDLCVTIHRSWTEFRSHKVLSMAELRESPHKHIPEKIAQMMCQVHAKECTIYCEACEEQVCHECIIKSHRDHQYNLTVDSAIKHKANMKARLETIQGIPGQLKQAIGRIDGICQGFSAKGQLVTDDINTQFDHLEEAIASRRKVLLQEITTMVEAKLTILGDQRAGLEMLKSKVTDCREFVDQTISNEHISEFLTLEHQMRARIADVKDEFSKTDLTPAEEPEANFTFDEQMTKSLQTAGNISNGSVLYGGTSSSRNFTVSEVITFYIALSSAYYKTKNNPMEEIKAEIQSLRDNSTCPATIAISSSGFAKLQCSFSERGRYSVSVKVGDSHISGSPYSFFVKPVSPQFQVPLKTIGKLNSPKGIAVNPKNHIVVSEENRHAISVFGKKLKKVLSFGSYGTDDAQFSHPIGVAVDKSGCIYVADCKNNRIKKFDTSGNLLAMFNGEQSPCGSLNGPTGIKINRKGKIFIVDRGNNRVVVINSNLEFDFTFGSPGSGLGQLHDPWDISFDENGFNYITDMKQHCIQIFNQLGEFRGKIGSHGTQKSRLNRPSGIAIDRFGRIFVCEFGNHRVSIFHVCSEFLDCFSTGLSMVNPCGVAVDDDGFVYVSSAETLHVF